MIINIKSARYAAIFAKFFTTLVILNNDPITLGIYTRMLWQLVLLFLLNLGTLGISTSNQVSQTTALRAAATLAQSASSADKAFRNVPPNWPIQRGYVAFGDSYGAGMGTGTTSTDGCRVGSNNFAALLMKWMGNPDIDFQLRVCSGDTLVGLNRQIGEWENPILADVATVSIGGNDLGFSDLVDSCLLHFKPWLEQKIYEEYCDSYKKTANKMLADQSTNGLKAKLKAAYKKILEKSERDVGVPENSLRCTHASTNFVLFNCLWAYRTSTFMLPGMSPSLTRTRMTAINLHSTIGGGAMIRGSLMP